MRKQLAVVQNRDEEMRRRGLFTHHDNKVRLTQLKDSLHASQRRFNHAEECIEAANLKLKVCLSLFALNFCLLFALNYYCSP